MCSKDFKFVFFTFLGIGLVVAIIATAEQEQGQKRLALAASQKTDLLCGGKRGEYFLIPAKEVQVVQGLIVDKRTGRAFKPSLCEEIQEVSNE